MDHQKLEYFINAAYYLNLTKAAEICHITQATMSRQIAALEDEVGVALFTRSKSGVQLTDAGIVLFNSATSLQEQYRDIIRACKNASKSLFPRLRIAAGPYEHLLIQQALQQLSLQYPGGEFSFFTYTYNILASRYTNHSIDFGFCTRACAEAVGNLKIIPILSGPWKVAAHRENPFWSLPEEETKLLKDQRIAVMYRNDFEPVEHYCHTYGLFPDEFVPTNFLTPLLMMLKTSNYIAVLPPFVCDTLDSTIRTELLLDPPLSVDFVAAYDPSNPNPGVTYFAEICSKLFSSN